MLLLQRNDGTVACEEAQNPACGNGLTDHRCDGCAPYPQIQCEDKHRVQNDIHHSTDNHRQHPDFREALCVDVAVHARCGHREHRAQQVNAEIVLCVAIRGIACTECVKNGLHKQIADCHDGCGADEQQGEGVAEDFCGTVMVACPSGDGEGGHTAHAEQCGECHDQRDDGQTQTHTCQRQTAAVTQMSDINAVYDVVCKLHQLRDGQRDCLRDNALPHGSLGKVDIPVHSRTSFAV